MFVNMARLTHTQVRIVDVALSIYHLYIIAIYVYVFSMTIN